MAVCLSSPRETHRGPQNPMQPKNHSPQSIRSSTSHPRTARTMLTRTQKKNHKSTTPTMTCGSHYTLGPTDQSHGSRTGRYSAPAWAPAHRQVGPTASLTGQTNTPQESPFHVRAPHVSRRGVRFGSRGGTL